MIAVVRLRAESEGGGTTPETHEAVGSDIDLIAASAIAAFHSVSDPDGTFAVWKPGANGPALVARAGRAFTVGERGALREIPPVELVPVPRVSP